MKLIVTIPALNEAPTIAEVIREIPRSLPGIDQVEVLVVDDGSRDGTVEEALRAGADYVISNHSTRGLAATFKIALQAALARGADIVVNTDADNHYDQSRIGELIAPVIAREADIAIGSRLIDDLPMRAANKYGNKAANYIMQHALHLPGIDVSTGFRAYTAEAAMRLNVLSDHTYTHETLINAIDQRLRIANVPIAARHVTRPSRLIKSIASHVIRAGGVILRSFLLYRPMQVYGTLGGLLLLTGAVPFARYSVLAATGEPQGHVQSLVIGAALSFVGVQLIMMGMLATAISWNRRMIEDVLFRLKLNEATATSDARRPRRAHISVQQDDHENAAHVTVPPARAA